MSDYGEGGIGEAGGREGVWERGRVCGREGGGRQGNIGEYVFVLFVSE